MIWNLQGTQAQQRIVRDALASCDFPFERLAPQLRSEAGRDSIPVEWADLSRYAASNEAAPGEHIHVHEHGDTGHPIERVVGGRARVLGLAWYSGRVTLDLSLERDPRLAAEVFLAEGAHMVDFFYMTDQHRRAIVNTLHHDQLPDNHPIIDGQPLGLDGHECGWFDVGPYGMWVGESLMEALIESFLNVKVTIQLGHPVSPVAASYIRRVLLCPVLVGTAGGKTYHRPSCPFIRPSWVLAEFDWPHPLDAERDGRRSCRVCRPK
jgi:hypothetical protein